MVFVAYRKVVYCTLMPCFKISWTFWPPCPNIRSLKAIFLPYFIDIPGLHLQSCKEPSNDATILKVGLQTFNHFLSFFAFKNFVNAPCHPAVAAKILVSTDSLHKFSVEYLIFLKILIQPQVEAEHRAWEHRAWKYRAWKNVPYRGTSVINMQRHI